MEAVYQYRYIVNITSSILRIYTLETPVKHVKHKNNFRGQGFLKETKTHKHTHGDK